MIGISRLQATQRTVLEAKLKWLGRSGDYEYATHDGREYAVEIRASPDPGDYNPSPGEILVARIVREVVDGSSYAHHRHHRGFPVADGTYAALAAKAKAKAEAKAPAAKPMRTWDALATLPAMQRRDPLRLSLGEHRDPLRLPTRLDGAEVPLPPQWDESPSVIAVGGNEPPERSPAGMIARLAGRGVELRLGRRRPRLVAESRTPIRFDDRQLLDEEEELIVGELRGASPLCSDCDEPAVGNAVPHAPMCAGHLEG